jgi:hypothetical protein
MKTVSVTLGSILACLLVLSACSHETPLEKQVATEVAAEPAVAPGKPMARKGREILFESDSLSPQQKDRLKNLYAKASAESAKLHKELSKNQLVLMKKIVNPKTKDDELDVLKDRIVSLEKQRTQLFLGCLDKAKQILGRKNSNDERFYRAFLFEPLEPNTLP